MTELITPETHPDHHVVGHKFRFWGVVFKCDSWEPCGYWMTPVDPTVEDPIHKGLVQRRNVSERAIGRTYHYVREAS